MADSGTYVDTKDQKRQMGNAVLTGSAEEAFHSLYDKIEEIDTKLDRFERRLDNIEPEQILYKLEELKDELKRDLEGNIDEQLNRSLQSIDEEFKKNDEEIKKLNDIILSLDVLLSGVGGMSGMSGMGGVGGMSGVIDANIDYEAPEWETYYSELIQNIKDIIGDGGEVADEDLKNIIIETLRKEGKKGNLISSPAKFKIRKDILIPKIIEEYISRLGATYQMREAGGETRRGAGGGGKRKKNSKKKKKSKKKKGKSKRKRSRRR